MGELVVEVSGVRVEGCPRCAQLREAVRLLLNNATFALADHTGYEGRLADLRKLVEESHS